VFLDVIVKKGDIKMRKISYGIFVLLLIAFLMGGCTTDPFTGEKKMSKTAWGSIIGGVGGAAVGAVTGHDSESRRKNALIGAGVGTIAGGGVGYYMDRQEAKLREKLQGTGVSVTRQGDRIILNMPGNITFRTNSAEIAANFYDVLNSVVLVLNEFNKTLINVYGHTDSTGSDSYNQSLSERRAASVGQYLTSHQVIPNRVMTMGFGKTKPIASNATPEGRQQNRRVELELAPLTQQ
jgi:outer membrane protein OmpA-like peptidoglycan-associated protein